MLLCHLSCKMLSSQEIFFEFEGECSQPSGLSILVKHLTAEAERMALILHFIPCEAPESVIFHITGPRNYLISFFWVQNPSTPCQDCLKLLRSVWH